MKRLALFTILLIALFAPAPVDAQSGATSVASGNWSSASTWQGGIIPSATMSATIAAGHVVTLNTNATVAGMTVAGELRYLPSASATLSSTANVIVYGKLVMKPSTPAIVHTLRFVGVNESNFAGGGNLPLASDVGLWVMCATDSSGVDMAMCAPDSPGGTLDIAGSPKTAWTHAAGSIAVGATQIALITAPAGWRVGDEISIAPTEAPAVGNASWNGFDLRTITAITGNTITLSSGTTRAHPIVTNPFDGSIYSAEILNLTRNVRIEGTGNGTAPLAGNGRAHIFIRSTQPQSIHYAAIRYMAPRQPDGIYTKNVLGRYGLHFHRNGDESRGSQIVGVVCRDAGSYCFVPHASHGITYQHVIAHNVFDEPFWWDFPPCNICGEEMEKLNDTHDITIDSAVAALVQFDPAVRGFSLSGFLLGRGNGNSVTNSVAVGVQGRNDAGGFFWPSCCHSEWVFENNISHNNKGDGIRFWQNDILVHVIRNFVAFHNGDNGIDHGAYSNVVQYQDIDLFANKSFDFNARALSRAGWRPDGYGQAFERLRIAGTFRIAEHNGGGEVATLVKDSIMAGILVNEGGKPVPGQYDFVNATKLDGTSIEPSDIVVEFALPQSVYRFQRANGTAWQMTGAGNVTTIASFYEMPLSPVAQQIADLLAAYPEVLQELIDAGIIP